MTNSYKNIFVSVVMPTYNGAKYLHRSINSILSQTHQNFEFIIVDDGSTDSTKEIINSFSDSRIVYLYQENKGPVFAYNKGFKAAKGEYIFIQDHDDYSYPDRIEKQLEYAVRNEIDICGTNYKFFHTKSNFTEEFDRVFNDNELNEKLLYLPGALFNPTVCIRKRVFQQFGFFNENYNVSFDCEFYLRTRKFVRKGVVKEYLVYWYKDNSSYSSRTNKLGLEKFRDTALLEISKCNFTKRQNYFYYGMLNYFTNHLVLSIYYLSLSFIYKRDRTAYKYFLVILLAWPLIKVMRSYEVLDFPFLRRIKRKLSLI